MPNPGAGLPLERLLLKNPSLCLFVATFSLLAGQAAAAALVGPAVMGIAGAVAATTVCVFLVRNRRLGLIVLLAVCAFTLGYGRHSLALNPRLPANHLRSVVEDRSEIYLEGVLQREPEKLLNRTRWLVRTERIWHPTGAEEIVGLIQLTVRNTGRDWRYGDRLRFNVRAAVPRETSNPGGFNYVAFLARRGIYVTGHLDNDAGVELLRRGTGGPWGAIENLRRSMRRFFEQRFSQDASALLKALVLGDRGRIGRDMRAEFAAAGVTHLLAISGLHVGMLAAVVFLCVRFLGSRSTFVLLRFNLIKIATAVSLLAVFLYTAVAGAMIPSVRASIMIGVYGLAVLLDREDEIWNSLCLAALLIAIYWPGAVMEPSFQLSFLAVLFILWGLRKMRSCFPARERADLPQERSRWRGWKRQAAFYLAVPLLATLGTGPLIAHHFGYLSLAGFLANPVIVPAVGFVLVPLGLLIGFLSLVAAPFAGLLVMLAQMLCGGISAGVQVFAHMPMAKLAVPIPNLLELGLIYLAVLGFFIARRRAHVLCLVGGLALAIVLAANHWHHERRQRKELRITFLSVGQGDSAVVEFPGSKVLLVDAGGTAIGDFDTGESIVAPFLRSRKIMRLDYVLVSHPRIDHYGGMKTMIEEFTPSEFWSGPSKGETVRYRELEEAVDKSKVEKVVLGTDDSCRVIDSVRVCALHPPKKRAGESSVVLRLSFGRAHVLFAGDLDRSSEKELLASRAELTGAVVKAPRHGGVGSSSQEFVEAVGPKLAIFSVGRRNPFGLPREEVVSRYRGAGAEILRTDEDGAIIVETDGQSIRYATHRTGKKGKIRL